MKICVHVLIKNEARFIWYSIMSVINHVDIIRIYDTGSTDKTIKIIEEILKNKQIKTKIFFKKVTSRSFKEKYYRQKMLKEEFKFIGKNIYTEAREEMLEKTVGNWIIFVDGDEIWWDDSIRQIVETIRNVGDKFESIVVPTFNVVGDIFHYQEKPAGRYHLAGRIGHYNLRALNRRIPGLKATGEHGTFGWIDKKGNFIEKRNPEKIKFLNAPYLHATHLRRSGIIGGDRKVYKRKKKLKYELGIPFPKDFFYPEVFFRPRPGIVLSPWETPNIAYKIRAFIETPPKKLRRRYFMWGVKPGY